jgi:hypothetical protein
LRMRLEALDDSELDRSRAPAKICPRSKVTGAKVRADWEL